MLATGSGEYLDWTGLVWRVWSGLDWSGGVWSGLVWVVSGVWCGSVWSGSVAV